MPFLAAWPRDEEPPQPTLSGLPQTVPYDTRPIPALGMIALKIYAFGGLAFMAGTILAALTYWIWVVVINQEFADSPPWLDLNPERMRAKEVARIARLKARKEEKLKEKERREQEKFSPPPLRINRRSNRNRSTTMPERPTTLPVVGFAETLPPPSYTSPVHKPIHSPLASSARPRKSSLSTGSAKDKDRKDRRVSWASSIATLDVNGVASEKPIDSTKPESEPSSPVSGKRKASSRLLPIPSLDNVITRVPEARAATPRVSMSIESRARSGREMIAVTTPDVVNSWAQPADQVERQRRWSAVDPLDTSRMQPGSMDMRR